MTEASASETTATAAAEAGTSEGAAAPAQRLHDCPDWLYLLREFDTLYRAGLAGGSRLIRSHRKRVRETLSAIIDADPAVASRGVPPPSPWSPTCRAPSTWASAAPSATWRAPCCGSRRS
ncbi:hypothetical protein [Tistlia consotensis]|uniref:hypothetical protein n=1 Tax=Tistlia consotensis TaxID=1321365 RepID=UPI00190E5E4F|nr:hypothetical protein [Tistlia consotensis]